MESFMANFHFLRPLWLLACVPALALFGLAWFIRVRSSRWHRAIDRSLLPHLLDTKQSRRQGWPLFVLLPAWLLTTISLAGPAWEKLPQPVRKIEDALVIIQDLSLSMYVRDLSPDRLTRARHKLEDILDLRKEGTTALVAYSGDAHVVTPLTDDSRTVKALLPALSPGIMPDYGSNAAEAVEIALQLFKDAGTGQGRILLLTDEVTPEDADRITRILKGEGVVLSVLGVGTGDGGPIPMNDGGFLKDNDGNIVIARLNSSALEDLAARNRGLYREITLDDTDIRYLLKNGPSAWQKDAYRRVEREFDQWKEMGSWLLLLIVPLALLAFRRGWLVVFVFAVLLTGQDSYAMNWTDLWLRKDQQGARALAENDPQQAAGLFSSPKWKAVAQYRAGNYDDAAQVLSQGTSADDFYNLGNALARTGKLEQAAAAYDQALARDPEMEDARINKELVEKLRRRQEQEQEQEQEKEKGKGKGKGKGKEKGKDKGKDSGEGKKQDGSQGAEQDQQSGDQNNTQGESSDQQDEQSPGQEKKNASERPAEQAGSRAEQNKEEGSQTEKQEKSKGSTEGEQVKKAQQPESSKNDGQPTGQQGSVPDNLPSDEEQQALEQWLRQIPDNPGGLLQRKFEYEYRRNRGQRPAGPAKNKIW
jgi:Ca-activated chloride channel family protein